MTDFETAEIWFVTGSQHLYGAETLRQVAAHAQQIASSLDSEKTVPIKIIFRPIMPISSMTPHEPRSAEVCL